MQRGEAVRGCGGDDVLPQGAADDAGGARRRVDAHRGQLGGAQQHDVVERAVDERPGTVAGALGGDPQARGGGRAHDVLHLGDRARQGHGRRPLVEGDVPRHPRGVVAGVAGQVHGAVAEPAQGIRRPGGPGVVEGGLDGHGGVLHFQVVGGGGSGDRGVQGHELAGHGKPVDPHEGRDRSGPDLREALREGVEHGLRGRHVGGADHDVGQLGRPQPGLGQGGLEVGQRQAELGREVVGVHEPAQPVERGLARDEDPVTRHRVGGHGDERAAGGALPTIPHERGLPDPRRWEAPTPHICGMAPGGGRRSHCCNGQCSDPGARAPRRRGRGPRRARHRHLPRGGDRLAQPCRPPRRRLPRDRRPEHRAAHRHPQVRRPARP